MNLKHVFWFNIDRCFAYTYWTHTAVVRSLYTLFISINGIFKTFFQGVIIIPQIVLINDPSFTQSPNPSSTYLKENSLEWFRNVYLSNSVISSGFVVSFMSPCSLCHFFSCLLFVTLLINLLSQSTFRFHFTSFSWFVCFLFCLFAIFLFANVVFTFS